MTIQTKSELGEVIVGVGGGVLAAVDEQIATSPPNKNSVKVYSDHFLRAFASIAVVVVVDVSGCRHVPARAVCIVKML